MTTDSVRPDRVIAAAESFLKLAADFGETNAAERVKASLEKLRLGIFRLVVVGEIKRGKSSFINALLGETGLLPTDDNVATSTVYKIAYGETKSYRVYFAPTDPDRPNDEEPPKDIKQEELADYGTEDGNPLNEKAVDFIAAQLPNPLLKQGLAIIDTPGLGGLFAKHAAITWRYVPNADAVFFVFDSVESVATKMEMEALARLAEMTPFLFFIQTKADLAGAEQRESWEERNLEEITKTLNTERDKLTYFRVSNKLKNLADRRNSTTDLERSGFGPVLQFLDKKLIGAMRERLARTLLNDIAREAGNVRRRLTDEQRIFSEESAEALKRLEREYSESRAQFEEWRKKSSGEVRELRSKLSDAKVHAFHRLQSELDAHPLGRIVGPLIEGLRTSGSSSRDLVSQAPNVQGRVVDFACKIVSGVEEEYNHRVIDLAQETSAHISRSLTVSLPMVTPAKLNVESKKLSVHLSGFEEGRSVFYGGSFGGLALGTLVGFFFPPAGLLAGFIGMIGGGFFGRRDHEIRKREEALRELASVLSNVVRLAQESARQELERSAASHERKATQAFESAAAEIERELREKMDAIAEASKRSRAENAQKAAAIQRQVTQVDGVLRLVSACLPEQAARPKDAMTA